MALPRSFQNLVENLTILPGVGEKTAERYVYALYEKEDYFFGYTKAMYKTDEIKISVDQIKDLQEKLNSGWLVVFITPISGGIIEYILQKDEK